MHHATTCATAKPACNEHVSSTPTSDVERWIVFLAQISHDWGYPHTHCRIDSVLPDFTGPPATVDYDTSDENYPGNFNQATESYNDFERVMDTLATMIAMTGVGLIGYAFVREAYDEDTTTPALRITLLILGTGMLLQMLGTGFNLSVSL